MGRKRKLNGKRLLAKTKASMAKMKKQGWKEHSANISAKAYANYFEQDILDVHPDWETKIVSENDGWSIYYRKKR